MSESTRKVRSAAALSEREEAGLQQEITAGGLTLSPGIFWLVFAIAWGVYAILFVVAERMQGVEWGRGVVISALAMGTAALPAVPVAMRRKRLLGPGITVKRFLLDRLVEGGLYALTAGTLTYLAFAVIPVELTEVEEIYGSGSGLWLAFVLNGSFLYAILASFLTGVVALERLDETRAQAAREAVLRAEAEAKAIRAQFNPHFVFNALHSLTVLVRSEPDRAERAIEDVAELIRYAATLQRREVDRVPLEKELAFARRYLALEKLRLECRLRVEWQVDDGLDSALVPAFALQTLLENAIKHGIAPKPKGGTVRVEVTRDGDSIRMCVDDDGAGARPEDVTATEGSGLRLLERRLAALHPDEASLVWTAEPGGGFTVEVGLPADFHRVSE